MQNQVAPALASRWAMLAVLCASLLLVAMDATILNVALPSLIDSMEPSPMEQLWIVDLYGLVLGGLLITCGAISDRYGRKRLFLAGFLLFGLASIVAATATAPAQLIAGRALLGVGGAMVMPSTLSLIRNIFTDDKERTLAIGIWASVAGAGAAIGPLVGGHLVEAFGWSAAFWLNVPVVVVTVAAGLWLLPEYRAPQQGSGLDWTSAVVSVLGIVALAWGIKHVAKGNPAAIDLVILVAAFVLLGLFAYRQLRSPDPLLDVRLFTNRAFTAAALATLLAMLAIGAALFLISLWLQYIHGYTPSQAGVRTLPAAIATLFGSLATPWLMQRVGVRFLMGFALGALAIGFAVLAAVPDTTYPLVALILVCLGIGDGIAITTAAAVMVAAVPPERAGQAGAVEETNYELGIGLGVALLGSIHGRLFTSHMTGLPLQGDDLADARGSVGGAAHVAQQIGGPTGDQVLSIAQHAYDAALTTTSWISTAMVGTVAVLTVILVPRGFKATAAH
ncbi:MFS transporter [Nocardia sp. CDC153]|uniref:MFS transporter n=1 Tax=Nocardia sp. CDC153 TaxID=3112167 RepID=UPI002DBE0C11|nr:MFS transporter [Nocardia sp. CDC153]MEC3952560.1 MFS transporter [Nocardia sp. CDC153]